MSDNVNTIDISLKKSYYHGTSLLFSQSNKDIFWVSEDPSLASDYALLREDISGGTAYVLKANIEINSSFNADKLGSTVTIGPFLMEMAKQSEEATGIRPEDTIMREIKTLLSDGRYVEESGPHYSPQDFWFNTSSYFGIKAAKELIGLYQKLGFDSIKFKENGSNTIGILQNGFVYNALSKEIISGTSKSVKTVFSRSESSEINFKQKVQNDCAIDITM